MEKARSLSIFLFIFLLGFFPNLANARFWRFEVGALGLSSTYEELRPTQSFLNKDFSQKSAGIQMEFQWHFIPKWFYFNFDVEYASPVSSNSSDEYTLINQFSQIALTLPARPLNLALVVEQNYNQMQTNNNSFGYDNFNAIQAFPQLDFTTPNGFMTVYGRLPLFSLLKTEKKEFAYGAIFRLSDRQAGWPEYYYLPGWNLKVEFREVELSFTEIRPVTIKTKDLTVSLSYSF